MVRVNIYRWDEKVYATPIKMHRGEREREKERRRKDYLTNISSWYMMRSSTTVPCVGRRDAMVRSPASTLSNVGPKTMPRFPGCIMLAELQLATLWCGRGKQTETDLELLTNSPAQHS